MVTDNLFIEYHRDNLLKKGKLRNYDKREGEQLEELELLADFQHHGTATCLLDFTRNALVALWFACNNPDKDGKVFVINTANVFAFQEVTPDDIKDTPVEDILGFKILGRSSDGERTAQDAPAPPRIGPKFWYWTPSHLNERIAAQGSLFIFGPPSSGMPISDEIIVNSGSKRQIMQELADIYDIHEESLFPDFVGFAYTQRHDATVNMPDATNYRNRGIQAHQRRELALAIEHYAKAIGLDPEYVDAYLSRGMLTTTQASMTLPYRTTIGRWS